MWNSRWKVAFEQDLSIGAIFSGKKYSDVPFFGGQSSEVEVR
jgi:hypothetical protein